MRAPFDSMFRWWRDGIGHSNGNGHAAPDGNGKPIGLPAAETQAAAIEPAWLSQLDKDGIPRTLRYPTTTLGRILDQAAERFGENRAITFNEQTWTYRQLLARVNRLAGGLSRLGVRAGDRVLLTLPNCPEFVLTFFAIQKLGAVVVNAGPLMGVDDLRRVMAITAPRVVIGLDLLALKIIEAARAAAPEHFIWVSLQSYQTLIRRIGYQIKLWQNRERNSGTGAQANHTTLAKVMENAPARPPTVEPKQEALALLQPTSGTTGDVKLVELTHGNLLSNATQVSAWMSPREGQESVLAVLPMFHVYGLMTGLLNPICCCASIILVTRFDAEAVLDLLIEHRPTVFPLVPAICDAISNEIERRDPRPVIENLRLCMSGAAPLPQEVAQRFENLTGARVVEGYGLSETSPVTHANLPSRPRYGTIGLPLPDTRCRIGELDDPSRTLATGQAGELLISGPQVMTRYFADPLATRAALWVDESGRTWLRTGDVARMDEDGFFQIMDRKKDMIIHSGLKVYPAKVERIIAAHPRVGEVAVVSQPDPVHTEEVVAAIVLKPFNGKESEDHRALADELRSLCRKHLAPYEVPSRFVFREQIPRSGLGKTLKNLLREQLRSSPAPKPVAPAAQPTEKEAA